MSGLEGLYEPGSPLKVGMEFFRWPLPTSNIELSRRRDFAALWGVRARLIIPYSACPYSGPGIVTEPGCVELKILLDGDS